MFKGVTPGSDTPVVLQRVLPGEAFLTFGAPVRFVSGVRALVIRQVAQSVEAFVAVFALMLFDPRVAQLVFVE